MINWFKYKLQLFWAWRVERECKKREKLVATRMAHLLAASDLLNYKVVCQELYLKADRRGETEAANFYDAQLLLIEWMLDGCPMDRIPEYKDENDDTE